MDLRILAFDEMVSRQKAALLSDPRVRQGLASSGFGPAGASEAALAERSLEQFAADARSSLRLIDGYVQQDHAVLEVGGGIGLTYAWLMQCGINITSLEPALSGHDQSFHTGRRLLAVLGVNDANFLPLPAEEAPRLGRSFSLIFSNNVLEHLSDLGGSLAALRACLAPGGVMRHNCPNYLIPYDPHFGLPLVPLWPRLLSHLRRDLLHSKLWQGLNFITSIQLVRWARAHGLSTAFDRDHLYQTFLRLHTEESFREKHPQLYTVSKLLLKSGILPLLRYLPPALLTPMQVTMREQVA